MPLSCASGCQMARRKRHEGRRRLGALLQGFQFAVREPAILASPWRRGRWRRRQVAQQTPCGASWRKRAPLSSSTDSRATWGASRISMQVRTIIGSFVARCSFVSLLFCRISPLIFQRGAMKFWEEGSVLCHQHLNLSLWVSLVCGRGNFCTHKDFRKTLPSLDKRRLLGRRSVAGPEESDPAPPGFCAAAAQQDSADEFAVPRR